MTDVLSPEMEAMLRIGGALKLATTPDEKPKQKRVQSRSRNTLSEPRRAPETDEKVAVVVEHPAFVPEPVSVFDGFDGSEDAYSAHEVLTEPSQPVKRGRGRPRKNPVIVRQPAGVKRLNQLHNIMAGDWEITGQINHDTRDITTACGYKAKRVYILRDKVTGRTIQAAIGEINAHTSLRIPKDDKQARKLSVESAFA